MELNDSVESYGRVRVIKNDVKTGEVVFDKVFKNKITNYALSQAAQLWGGNMVPIPSKIALGNGSNPSGANANDQYLWNEISGSRQQIDYAIPWLSYYTQYAITYDQTEVLAPMTSWEDNEVDYTTTAAAGPYWTVGTGVINFSYTGATIASTGSYMTSKQAVNMDPTSVGTVAVSQGFKLASSSPVSNFVRLYQSSGNYYELALVGKNIRLSKVVNNGTKTTLVTSSYDLTVGPAVVVANGNWLTLQLSLDVNGVLTGKVWPNLGTAYASTPADSITVTDTALPGPYSLVVGGDVNTLLQYADATYPSTDPLQTVTVTEAGLFDVNDSMWSHVPLTGVTHDNTTTLTIQWQVQQKGN